MPRTREQIEAEAIDWAIRLRDAGPREWEEFTSWLEADPRHRQTYDEVALAEQEWGCLPRITPRAVAVPHPSARPRWMDRRAFIAAGAAAFLVASVTVLSKRGAGSDYVIETAPGERRSVELADGSHIDMNGSTRLVLDTDRPRFAKLESGEALFTVVHDESRPFEVAAGGSVIRDLGTVFNVAHVGEKVEVGVAEGEVLFNPDRQAISLSPGMRLREQAGRVTVGRTDPEAISSWVEGRLSYSSAPVSRIAADLSRNLGVPVHTTPDVADRRFSGVIVIDSDQEKLFRRVAPLLGVAARRTGGGWLLTAETGATS